MQTWLVSPYSRYHCGISFTTFIIQYLNICLWLIYSLHFGFGQHYSTSYALLNLTESIIKAIDEGNFASGIFVDLQKAFDTVDHNILKKLDRYGVRGTSFNQLNAGVALI